MKWSVKTKDPWADNMYRWVEKFAFLPVKTETHWVWLEKYWQFQFSRRSLWALVKTRYMSIRIVSDRTIVVLILKGGKE